MQLANKVKTTDDFWVYCAWGTGEWGRGIIIVILGVKHFGFRIKRFWIVDNNSNIL